MIFTLIGICILWSMIDWVLYGSQWAHATVFAKMDPAIWSRPRAGESLGGAERRTMIAAAMLTLWSAIVFTILGEWVGAPSFGIFSGGLFVGLLWAGFILPIFLFDRLYLMVGTRFTMLQLIGWLAKISVGVGVFLLRG